MYARSIDPLARRIPITKAKKLKDFAEYRRDWPKADSNLLKSSTARLRRPITSCGSADLQEDLCAESCFFVHAAHNTSKGVRRPLTRLYLQVSVIAGAILASG